jgi:hypothetical protein
MIVFSLLVAPSGGKLWHFKYRFVNKERAHLYNTGRLAPLVFVRPGELRQKEIKDGAV